MKNHFKDELSEVIVWWDLFSINQHIETQWTFEWLSTTFMSAIQEIGRVVMVMSPWNNPIPYSRAWCVFEAYCAIFAEDTLFEIALSSKEEERFLNDMITLGNGVLNQMLADIRSEKS